MITIHDKLWVVKGVGRNVPDSDYLLAYMAHQEYAKDGEKTQSFLNRQETGINWSKGYKDIAGEEMYFDNLPASGYRIVGSVSRWSTSNKLIQVEDPRGFVVEIPTGNLTTLLKHTVVDKGEVKDKCVWGREGSNHILLPINSEVYQQAKEQTQQNKEKITLSKLEIGQTVKFSVDDSSEYAYIGRGKAVWEVSHKVSVKTAPPTLLYNRPRYIRDGADEVESTETVRDDRLAFIFKRIKGWVDTDNWDSYRNWKYKTSGKCVVVGEIDNVPAVELFQVSMPDRHERYSEYTNSNNQYTTVKTIDIEMKGD